MKYSILFFIAILIVGCGQKSNSPSTTAPVTEKPSAPISEQSYESYPSISMEEMQELATRTSNIDYMFYELPISMNLDNAPAINSALRQISDQPAKIMKGCKPMGRVIFQDNGDIFKEADFYFAAPCFGFVFIEGSTKVNSNMMTEEGATFFGNLLKNAGQQAGQQ